jgi:hypothetical protein
MGIGPLVYVELKMLWFSISISISKAFRRDSKITGFVRARPCNGSKSEIKNRKSEIEWGS